MNKTKTGNTISMMFFIILGVVLILFPSTALTTLIRIIGAALVLIGGIKVYAEMTIPEKSISVYAQIFSFAVTVLIGAVFLLNPAFIESLFPMFMGTIMALTGILNLIKAIECKNGEYGSWQKMMIFSAIMICLGVVIFANPFSTMNFLVRIIGFSMVYNGITSIWIGLNHREFL